MSAIDKAVILARGLGTRMRKNDGDAALTGDQAAAADSGIKALIPIDRPFLDYLLHVLASAGYRRVCLVIGPEHDLIRRYYGQEVELKRLRIEFAVQEKPLGTANAVAAAEEFAGGDGFLMINSDNYYPLEALRGLRELDGPGVALFERNAMIAGSNISPDRISAFAVGAVGPGGVLQRVIEKPSPEVLASLPEPVSVSMNCWRFDKSIFEACRKIKPSARNEYEITDAVQYAIDHLGTRFMALTIHAPVLDLSSRKDVGPVAAKLAGTEVNL